MRKCRPEDLSKILVLAEKYAAFDASPTMADIEMLYDRDGDNFFVAEDDLGNILGFAAGYQKRGVPEEVLRSLKAKRVGYLELMAVNEQYRRQGIGTALLKSIMEQFRHQVIDTILLDVPFAEQDAIRLYQKHGFRVRAYNMIKHA